MVDRTEGLKPQLYKLLGLLHVFFQNSKDNILLLTYSCHYTILLLLKQI